MCSVCGFGFLFFKQKTAYEMRISDWSSDVCSSDLSTAGNLVFQGTADGYFTAYDAESGKQLWQFNAGLGILGGPMSFSSGGKQYVSVLVGYGGSAAVTSDMLNVGWKFNAQPGCLLTFEHGGKAKIGRAQWRERVRQDV